MAVALNCAAKPEANIFDMGKPIEIPAVKPIPAKQHKETKRRGIAKDTRAPKIFARGGKVRKKP